MLGNELVLVAGNLSHNLPQPILEVAVWRQIQVHDRFLPIFCAEFKTEQYIAILNVGNGASGVTA